MEFQERKIIGIIGDIESLGGVVWIRTKPWSTEERCNNETNRSVEHTSNAVDNHRMIIILVAAVKATKDKTGYRVITLQEIFNASD